MHKADLQNSVWGHSVCGLVLCHRTLFEAIFSDNQTSRNISAMLVLPRRTTCTNGCWRMPCFNCAGSFRLYVRMLVKRQCLHICAVACSSGLAAVPSFIPFKTIMKRWKPLNTNQPKCQSHFKTWPMSHNFGTWQTECRSFDLKCEALCLIEGHIQGIEMKTNEKNILDRFVMFSHQGVWTHPESLQRKPQRARLNLSIHGFWSTKPSLLEQIHANS